MNSAGSGSTDQYLQWIKVSGNQAKVCQSDLPGLPASSQITSLDPAKKVTGATAGPFRCDCKTDRLWGFPINSGKCHKKLTKILDLSLGKGQLVNALPKVTVNDWFENPNAIKAFGLSSGAV